MTVPRLSDFIKAYDVRGVVPEQLNGAVAFAIGSAFARVVARPDGATSVVIGHDMRPSSPELSRAFAAGVAGQGLDVTLIGLCSTDGLYYASGALDVPGAMFTASHNPAQYNGIKLCRSGARPVGQDTGLTQVRDLAQSLLDSGEAPAGSAVGAPAGSASSGPALSEPAPSGPAPSETAAAAGTISERDVLSDYATFLRGLVNLSEIRPLTVVVDAGNGMGGHTVPAVLGSTTASEDRSAARTGASAESGPNSGSTTASEDRSAAAKTTGSEDRSGARTGATVESSPGRTGASAESGPSSGTSGGLPALPLTVIPLYFELDGTFPNHEANPLNPENLRDLQAAVIAHGADLGLAFDGDADRCFVVDERGEPVSPSAVTALVATREIAKEHAAGRPKATIVYNVISSAAVPEIIAEAGGTAVRTRVGHSFIKGEMARHQAVFGGEHSAHYYFRDFWFADTGMLAAMHVLAALGEQSRPISEVVARFTRYAASGEINSTVADAGSATADVRAWAQAWARDQAQDVEFDELDGMTVTHPGAPMWWFNLRASNTEPLLRLNVEAVDVATMEWVRDDVLSIVRGKNLMTETQPTAEASAPSVHAPPAPQIEPWLREILRCPKCRSTLSDGSGPSGPELHCTDAECRLAYRIDDGIPVLLVDESRSLAG